MSAHGVTGGILKSLALVAASGLLAMGGLESAVRVFAPQHLKRTQGMFAPDPDAGFRMTPGFRGREVGRGIDAGISINARGLRDRDFDYAKPAGVFRILVLGDSWTYGSGVEGEQTYPKALERLLVKGRPGRMIEVINAGVSAYGTVNELAWFRADGKKYSPDLVILGFFAGNDLFDNTHPDRLRVNGHGELVAKNSRPGRLERLKRFVRTRSHLYRFAGDRYHARGEIRGRISRYNWGIFEEPPAPEIAEAWTRSESLIDEIAREVRGAGARFAVADIPRLYQIHPPTWKEFVSYYRLAGRDLDPARPGRRLGEFCRRNGIPFLPLFQGLARRPDPESLYHGHWTAAGNEAAAELIARGLENAKLLP